METFSYRASSVTQRKKPRVTIAAFGDGYEQRQADGLHPNLMEFDLMFESVSQAVGDAIEVFLDARGSVESFNWTPPKKSVGIYVCDTWDRRWNSVVEGESTISGHFKQVPA